MSADHIIPDPRDLAVSLAKARFVADLAKEEADRLKAALEPLVDPGSRIPAMLPDADGRMVEVGTITRAKVTTAEELVVTDDDALIAWAETNGHDDGVRVVKALHDWKMRELLAAAKSTGELPDGVEYRTREKGGYFSIRQTDDHKEALAALGLASVLEIERGTS